MLLSGPREPKTLMRMGCARKRCALNILRFTDVLSGPVKPRRRWLRTGGAAVCAPCRRWALGVAELSFIPAGRIAHGLFYLPFSSIASPPSHNFMVLPCFHPSPLYGLISLRAIRWPHGRIVGFADGAFIPARRFGCVGPTADRRARRWTPRPHGFVTSPLAPVGSGTSVLGGALDSPPELRGGVGRSGGSLGVSTAACPSCSGFHECCSICPNPFIFTGWAVQIGTSSHGRRAGEADGSFMGGRRIGFGSPVGVRRARRCAPRPHGSVFGRFAPVGSGAYEPEGALGLHRELHCPQAAWGTCHRGISGALGPCEDTHCAAGPPRTWSAIAGHRRGAFGFDTMSAPARGVLLGGTVAMVLDRA